MPIRSDRGVAALAASPTAAAHSTGVAIPRSRLERSGCRPAYDEADQPA